MNKAKSYETYLGVDIKISHQIGSVGCVAFNSSQSFRDLRDKKALVQGSDIGALIELGLAAVSGAHSVVFPVIQATTLSIPGLLYATGYYV